MRVRTRSVDLFVLVLLVLVLVLVVVDLLVLVVVELALAAAELLEESEDLGDLADLVVLGGLVADEDLADGLELRVRLVELLLVEGLRRGESGRDLARLAERALRGLLLRPRGLRLALDVEVVLLVFLLRALLLELLRDEVLLLLLLLFRLLRLVHDHVAVRVEGLRHHELRREREVRLEVLPPADGVVLLARVRVAVVEPLHPLDELEVVLVLALRELLDLRAQTNGKRGRVRYRKSERERERERLAGKF